MQGAALHSCTSLSCLNPGPVLQSCATFDGPLFAGSLVTHLDMPDHVAATPQMTALHHLQQVQQGFSMPAGQLHQDLHQLPLSYLPTTPLQHAAELQLQRLTKVSMYRLILQYTLCLRLVCMCSDGVLSIQIVTEALLHSVTAGISGMSVINGKQSRGDVETMHCVAWHPPS